eukprot:gene13733-biopygen3124
MWDRTWDCNPRQQPITRRYVESAYVIGFDSKLQHIWLRIVWDPEPFEEPITGWRWPPAPRRNASVGAGRRRWILSNSALGTGAARTLHGNVALGTGAAKEYALWRWPQALVAPHAGAGSWRCA